MPGPLYEAWHAELQQFQTGGNQELEAMADAATAFVGEVAANDYPRWITFLGPSGTGKTMLARMIMRFIKQHLLWFTPGYGVTLTHQAYSARWPEMVSEMKKGNFDTVDLLVEQEPKWNGIKAATYHFAMIDDIGQVEDAKKAYLVSALARIADRRLREWTIWTSNLHLSQIAELVDPRVSSRMIRDGNVVVENNCEDFNLR